MEGITSRTGTWVVEWIVEIASWLTGASGESGESTPGLVSLALLAALVVLSIWYGISAWRFNRSVSACHSILPAQDEHITREHLVDIDKRFKEFGQRKGSRRRLGIAWDEFRETTIEPERETDQLRNTVRPAVFFSREELGLEGGIWRRIPALFVSVGLFLTFLGLVAALQETRGILDEATQSDDPTRLEQVFPVPESDIADSAKQRGDPMARGLQNLLQVASAKFIMSLTGLLCSIIFTLVSRYIARRTDDALHFLCAKIENCCIFLSEQKLLVEMLSNSKEQTDQLRALSTELVAQIAQPLREELPEAIRMSIEQAMTPAIETLTRSTGQSIESMAANASGQLVDGVQKSVQAMNEAIGNVTRGLEVVTGQIDQSAGTMSGQVDDAVQALANQIGNLETAMAASSKEAARTFNSATETMLQDMNETLQEIQNSSTEGARQMGETSRAMADAAGTLSHAIQASVMASAEAGGREIERAGQEMASGIATATATMRENLLDPMSELTERVGNLSSSVGKASGQVGKYADSVESSAIAVLSANEGLERSTQTLVTATAPIRDAVTGIESANRTMGDRVEAASYAMRQTSEHTESIMRGTREAIEASRTTTREALTSLQNAVGEFKGVVERYDQIDQNLGDAFQQIKTAVQSSINEIGEFADKLNEEFGKALNQLQAVIAQAEPFTPRRKE